MEVDISFAMGAEIVTKGNEVGESSSAPTARPTGGFRSNLMIGDERQLNLLHRDRHSHARTARLMEGEARAAREAWALSMDASDTARFETQMVALQSQKRPNRDPAHPDVLEGEWRLSSISVTVQLRTKLSLLLAPFMVLPSMVKTHVTTVVRMPAHGMPWTHYENATANYCLEIDSEIRDWRSELALLCGRMFPEESNKIEKYVGGLPNMIHGSVMVSKSKTMQDAIEFTTELMDKKISTFAKRQAENKRKFDDTSRNNQNQQKPPKRHNVARAYTAGPGKKKPYRGSKPLCSKCNYHHDGPCDPKCHKCNRVGHLARALESCNAILLSQPKRH
ncbi:hypothetical protein Tco_0407001 [Tanacetum coccineum]